MLTARDVRALEAVEDAIHAAGSLHHRPCRPDRTRRDRAPCWCIRGRWDKLDVLVIAGAYLPHLTPVTQIDGKQLGQAMTMSSSPRRRCSPISTRCSTFEAGRGDRPDQQRRRSPACLLGGLWRNQGGVRQPARNLRAGGREAQHRSASPSSIRAPPAPTCAPRPIRGRPEDGKRSRKPSRTSSSNCSRISPPATASALIPLRLNAYRSKLARQA